MAAPPPSPRQTQAQWNKCVQSFDKLGPVPRDGSQNAVLRSKLEIERVRLLAWGQAAGFNSGQHEDYMLKFLNLRGGIGFGHFDLFIEMFSNPALLTTVYGLRQEKYNGSHKLDHPQCILGDVFRDAYEVMPPEVRQRTTEAQHQRHSSSSSLGHALKRAYTGLRRSSKKENRKSMPPTQGEATGIWILDDETKFQGLLAEIKMCTDILMSVYMEYGTSASETLRRGIVDSQDIRALALIQSAAAGVYEDLSQAASARVQALGTTVPVRTSTVQPASSGPKTSQKNESKNETGQQSQRWKELDDFVKEKRNGALKCDLDGPRHDSPVFVGVALWEGYEDKSSEWHDQYKGHVKVSHPAFALYHRKKFPTNNPSHQTADFRADDRVLLSPESHPAYEHEKPGTVTVEGLGFECWIYGERIRRHGRTISTLKMPEVGIPSLLRRMDELRRNVRELGLNPDLDDAELEEFMGDPGRVYLDPERARDPGRRISELYAVLNRRDVVADFTATLSVALKTTGNTDTSIGPWNFFRQLILTKELARRLDRYPDKEPEEFSPPILASLIIADQWFGNMIPTLKDQPFPTVSLPEPRTPEMQARVKSLSSQANEAMAAQQFQKAADLYAETIEIDGKNALYRSNRSYVLQRLNRSQDAYQDAWSATQIDPNYAWAYTRLGSAAKQLGKMQSAIYAYQRALDLAAHDSRVTDAYKESIERSFVEAVEKMSADEDACRNESDMRTRNKLHAKISNQDWDVTCKVISFQSTAKDRQIDGLVSFAERLRWPYTNEVRNCAETAYQNILTGQQVTQDLHDWLFGILLPGSYMAFKIMAALISCSPALCPASELDITFSSGLSLPKQSYWRVDSALGRVLAPLQGVTSLCGWLGPCPSVEIVNPSSSPTRGFRECCIDLRAPEALPVGDNSNKCIQSRTGGITLTLEFTTRAIDKREDESDKAYSADIRNHSHWTVPSPPHPQSGTCSVQSVRLEATSGTGNKAEQPDNPEYLASVVFILKIPPSSKAKMVTYRLETCPAFVTLPTCFPNVSQNERKSPSSPLSHEVHSRELPRYKRGVWNIEQLDDHRDSQQTSGRFQGEIVVINATAEGAEIPARAWCAQRGKSAAIRYRGGPCYACAHRATGTEGLGLGVLIWVS